MVINITRYNLAETLTNCEVVDNYKIILCIW